MVRATAVDPPCAPALEMFMEPFGCTLVPKSFWTLMIWLGGHTYAPLAFPLPGEPDRASTCADTLRKRSLSLRAKRAAPPNPRWPVDLLKLLGYLTLLECHKAEMSVGRKGGGRRRMHQVRGVSINTQPETTTKYSLSSLLHILGKLLSLIF